MSTTIDEKVVEMRFDNARFEKNVQTSISTLDKLKNSLRMEGAAEGFENIGKSSRELSFDKLISGVEALQSRFSTFGIIGMRVLENLTDSMMRLADKTLDFLTNGIVQGGITRAMNLENAHFQLQGLLKDEEAVAAVMKNVSDSVDGTAYSLDSAAKVASQLAASGMRAGDEMFTSLRAVAGVAAMTNSEYDDIGRIFTQVAGNGRLMGDQLLQLSSRGMNAAATIAEYLGVTEGEVRELVSKGEISFEIFASAMDDAFGEHAKKANETFTGALSNIRAALARIGAGFISPLVEQNGALVTLFNTVRERVNDVKKALVFDEALGNVNALSKQFTDFVIKIANAATEYLADLDLSKPFEIFYNAIESVKNVVKGLGSILKPIAQAFRDIFPPKSIDTIVSISEKVKELTANFKLNEKDAENLRSTFKGLFAIFDIVRQAIKSVISAILPAGPALGDMGSNILSITGKIGEWLASVDEAIKKNDAFTKAIQAVKDKVKAFIDFIKPGLEKVKELLRSVIDTIKDFAKTHFSAPDTSGFDSFTEKISSKMEPLKKIFEVGKKIFAGIVSFFKTLAPVFLKIGEVIGDALGQVGDTISKAFNDKGFEGVLDIVNGGVLAGIGVAIAKFIKGLTDVTSNAGSFISNIKGIFSGVNGCLTSLQEQVKSNTLLKIAGAIAILAASLVVLSLIDGEKLSNSLAMLTALFADLMGSMALFTKISGGGDSKAMSKAATSMIKISAAVLILSFAMKTLAGVDQDNLNNALVALTGLMADLVASTLALSKWGDKVKASATGMILFSVAIKILSGVVEKFGEMSWDTLEKGLTSIGIVMAELAAFMLGAKFGDFKAGQGLAMIELAAALIILQKAVASFGNMDTGAIVQGLVGMGVVLAELAAFMKLSGDSKRMITTATGLTILGAAMLIFADAVAKFGDMSWEQMGKGLLGMGAALAAVAIAMNSMPATTPLIAAGMLLVGAALKIIADAVMKFGEMSWEGIAKGLVTLAGSLVVIAFATNMMTGALSGAAAMLVVSAALSILVKTLQKAGKMSWEEIGKGLLVLAGAFAVIGVAGLVLAPLTPVILALAGAIALLGIGITGCGIGLLAFSAALTALATTGAAGIAVLILCIESILSLIPVIITKVGEGIVALLATIGSLFPAIGDTINGIFEMLKTVIPGLLDLLSTILLALADNFPLILDTVFKLIMDILGAIKDNIWDIVDIVVDVVVELLAALTEKLPELLQAGIDIVINLIEGLAKGIEDNADRIHQALIDLGTAMITLILSFFGIHSPSTVFADIGKNLILGLINGIASMVKSVLSKIGELLKSMVKAIKDKFNEFKEKGKELMTKLKDGIVGKMSEIKNKAKEVITGAINGIKEKIQDFKNVGRDIIDGLKNGIENAKDQVVNTVKNIASSAIDTVKDFLGIHSPSRVFADMGENVDKGFINGLLALADGIYAASSGLGESAIDGLSSTISGIAKLMELDVDYEPTIRPVLDLTDLQSGVNAMDRMLYTSRTIDLAGNASVGVNAAISRNQNAMEKVANNDDVVSAISELRRDVSTLADAMSRFKVVLDSGTLVGEMAGPMNNELGRMAKYDGRRN